MKVYHTKLQACSARSIACLVNANEKSIHEKCLEFPMMEVYKNLNGVSSRIMNDISEIVIHLSVKILK